MPLYNGYTTILKINTSGHVTCINVSKMLYYLILSFSFRTFLVLQNSLIQMPSSHTTKFVISMHIRFSSTLYLEHYSTTLKAFLSIVLTMHFELFWSTFSDRLRWNRHQHFFNSTPQKFNFIGVYIKESNNIWFKFEQNLLKEWSKKWYI